MRPLSLARVLFALLAFQLAVGLQADVASAAVAQKVDSHAACPEHAQRSTIDSAHRAVKLPQDQQAHDSSTPGHDCCKSSGCQCHCGNLPLAGNVIAIRAVPDSSPGRAVPITRSVSAPADNLFRPPIAS